LTARAGRLEAEAHVVAGLVQGEGREASDGGDALIEGVVRGLGQALVERGVTGEDEAGRLT
jgi:hypothetical protein